MEPSKTMSKTCSSGWTRVIRNRHRNDRPITITDALGGSLGAGNFPFFAYFSISLFSVLIISPCIPRQPARPTGQQERCVKPIIWKELNLNRRVSSTGSGSPKFLCSVRTTQRRRRREARRRHGEAVVEALRRLVEVRRRRLGLRYLQRT